MGVKKDSNFLMKFVAGSLAGAIGSIAGNPFDVLKTQMMAKEGEVKTMVNTAKHLFEHGGIGSFYRGIEANILRAMVLNGTKMAVYDTIKIKIKESNLVPAGLVTDFISAFGAGFFMAVTVSPFDMIRTRLMNQPANQKIYKNFLDCGIKIITKDGPLGLYAGFVPIWGRFAPTTTLQLVIFEQVKPFFGVTGSSD